MGLMGDPAHDYSKEFTTRASQTDRAPPKPPKIIAPSDLNAHILVLFVTLSYQSLPSLHTFKN
jgi:hypothetical protein